MKFKSAVITQASGSIGGTTYSHNAGGMYMRARSIPTNPGTAAQSTVRALMAQLVNIWSNVLVGSHRGSWDIYAANVPLLDAFGDPRYVSGLNHFIRSNLPRMQFGLDYVSVGPGIFNLGDYTLPTVTASEITQALSTGFNVSDDWVSEDGAALLEWSSRPMAPTINFFKGPYQAQNVILGDSGAPPTSPDAHSSPFNFVEGQQIRTKYNVSRADGRLGTVSRSFCIAAA